MKQSFAMRTIQWNVDAHHMFPLDKEHSDPQHSVTEVCVQFYSLFHSA